MRLLEFLLRPIRQLYGNVVAAEEEYSRQHPYDPSENNLECPELYVFVGFASVCVMVWVAM